MKYVDIAAVIQVIGSIYQNPMLLENENYFFNEDDFTLTSKDLNGGISVSPDSIC